MHDERQRKEEEMKQMFVQRVKEKEAILKEAEKEASLPTPGCPPFRACCSLGRLVLKIPLKIFVL